MSFSRQRVNYDQKSQIKLELLFLEKINRSFPVLKDSDIAFPVLKYSDCSKNLCFSGLLLYSDFVTYWAKVKNFFKTGINSVLLSFKYLLGRGEAILRKIKCF